MERTKSTYETKHFCQLVNRDCRTFGAAKKRIPKRIENSNKSLCYQSIKYVCKFSGTPRNSDVKRKRTTKSIRSNCPFELELVLSHNNQELEVVKFVEEHNHILNKDIYEHLPRQRALPEDLALEVKESIKLKANKKLLQPNIQTATGKKVTLKDLSNLRQQNNKTFLKMASVTLSHI